MKRKTLTRVQLAKHWRDVGYFVGKGEGYAAAIEDAAKVLESRINRSKSKEFIFLSNACEGMLKEIKALLPKGTK